MKENHIDKTTDNNNNNNNNGEKYIAAIVG